MTRLTGAAPSHSVRLVSLAFALRTAACSNSTRGPSWSQFLVRLSPEGTIRWTQKVRPLGNVAFGWCCTVMGDGGIVAAGSALGGGTFGYDGDPDQQTITSTNGGLGYVWKVDADGKHEWLRYGRTTSTSGGSWYQGFNWAKGDADGGIVLVGNHANSFFTFDDGVQSGRGRGLNDLLVVRYDVDGNRTWFTDIRGWSVNRWPDSSSVTAAPDGDVVVSGTYAGQVAFPDGTIFGQGGAPWNTTRSAFVVRFARRNRGRCAGAGGSAARARRQRPTFPPPT